MNLDPDPSLWKQVSGWLWAVLAVPLAALWRKADNSASKEELQRAFMHFTETTAKLFDNAEKDRALAASRHIDLVNMIHETSDKLREDLRR